MRNPFTTVKTSGQLLPVDLLARIVDNDSTLKGLSPEAYHLNAGERLNEAASRAWNSCLNNWKAFRVASAKLLPSDQGTTLTRDKWLLPLFRELGYGWLQANKRSLESGGKSYPISHQWQSHVAIHLVSFRHEIDRRTPGATGATQRSPYSLVQEFLNRSAHHRWGFVSNGLKLDVLHDNVSLIRAANVEFDLEAMFEGEVYADFFLLFSLCHQSRVEILAEERPQECWLERWSKQAEEQGTRAQEKLRIGVERAIQALGTGFRTGRGNTSLNDALRTGSLDTQEFYRELLRMIYRILLLLVAEDKRINEDQNLLHPLESAPEARRRYSQYYSMERLRKLASRRHGTAHTDLYESLKVLFDKLRDGYTPLAIPGLGSFLFSPETTPHLDRSSLANEHLLEAIRHLCYTEDVSGRGGSLLRPVDFGNLGAEELGSIYESLLELHPRIDSEDGPFTLAVAAGHERKTTGSYYTPTSLINCLLDSALEPVVQEALGKLHPIEALLNLKICDPACGSGHFLIAAAERMAKHLARLRSGDEEPSSAAIQQAKRIIIGRCIFGVDLNPMAAELCKVSLWMEALDPGKPLTFLDHHIQVGNSLLGATPAMLDKGIPDEAFEVIAGDDKAVCREYRKRNKDERTGQGTFLDLFATATPDDVGTLSNEMLELKLISDDTIQGIRNKEARYSKIITSNVYEARRLVADAWCSAFVWKKLKARDNETLPEPITEKTFRAIERDPHNVSDAIKREIRRLSSEFSFLHWHVAFPDVFDSGTSDPEFESPQRGWTGGFDLILGNPPWDKIQPEEEKFFAANRPDIANAENARLRKSLIEALPETDPHTHLLWHSYKRKIDSTCHLLGSGGFLQRSGEGNLNTYRAFTELTSILLSPRGRAGLVVQTGLATDESGKELFSYLMATGKLLRFLDFENKKVFFADVHPQFRFSLLTLVGDAIARPNGSAEFGWLLHSLEEAGNPARLIQLNEEDILLFNPSSRTCPVFCSRTDFEISQRIYREGKHIWLSPERRLGKIEFLGELFNMTRDSHFFVDRDHSDSRTTLQLYEAKYIHQYDHRFATCTSGRVTEPSLNEKCDPSFKVRTSRVVDASEVRSRLRNRGIDSTWLCGFRDIARATDERTAIMTIFPISAVGNSINLALGLTAVQAAFLTANTNSFAFDYCCRQKTSGAHVNIWIYKQLPAIAFERMNEVCRWSNDSQSLGKWVVQRAIELIYTGIDLTQFAQECQYDGPPFVWHALRRFHIRCELDACFFHLYNLSRNQVAFIMDTFPILQRKEIQTHGEYRTKRFILEIYDSMAGAIKSGDTYKTVLDPSAADFRFPRSSDL